jgi:large subunit ribosomal protein L5
MAEENKKQVEGKENPMREIEMEKVILGCAGTDDKLDKSVKLLELITGKKVKRIASSKRIPSFGVRPGLDVGCMVTLRNKEKIELLNKLLESVNKKLKAKQVKENSFSFGIPEYLEIPGIEYQREIGILGLDVTVVFKRKGKRASIKKIKQGRLPKKQHVSAEEIIKFMENKFEVEFERKGKKEEEE